MSSEILTIIAALQRRSRRRCANGRAGCGGCATASGARSAAGSRIVDGMIIGNRSPRFAMSSARTRRPATWREAYINAQAQLGVF